VLDEGSPSLRRCRRIQARGPFEPGAVVLVVDASSWRWVRYVEVRIADNLPWPIHHILRLCPPILLHDVLLEGTPWVEVSVWGRGVV
jgi:hypothetical protein